MSLLLSVAKVNAMTPDEVLEAARLHGTLDGRQYKNYSPAKKRLYNRYQIVRANIRARKASGLIAAQSEPTGNSNTDGLSVNDAITMLEIRRDEINESLEQLRSTQHILQGLQARRK